MIDLLQAAQDAVFTALKASEAAAGLPDGHSVFQHVPEFVPPAVPPPMTVVGMMTSVSADEHGDQVEMITAEVQYVYRGPGRAPLLAMMHAGRTALDKQDITAADAQFEPPRFMRAEASDALADGVTYVGLQYFEFLAEPA